MDLTDIVMAKSLAAGEIVHYSAGEHISITDNVIDTKNVATLENGKVPTDQLPSFVDDVIEGYFYNDKFYKDIEHTQEIFGEANKIYVDLHTNNSYRWSGSAFILISIANVYTKEETNLKLNEKVTKEILSSNGKAMIFNEVDGGGAKFEASDGLESYVGVNHSDNGIAAQIYADKLIDGKWTGAKLDVKNDGIYYTVGDKSAAERDVAENEIAVVGDIPTKTSELTNDSGFLTEHQSLADYSTTEQMNTAINTAVSAKQDTLVSGTNIKTVNGNNILGNGNIAITTYQPIPLTPYSQTTQEVGKWRTKTMEMFMEDIIADPSAIKGMAYLSTVGTVSGDHDFYNSDIMPTCCELKVEIMQVETSGTGIHKIARLTATSTNNSPYTWTRDLEGGTSPWEPFYYFPWRAALPPCPDDNNGIFVLKGTVNNGSVTYSWVAEN